MVRTQVQLEDRQFDALRDLSERTGKSLAELVRQAVGGMLRAPLSASKTERRRRALEAAGRFGSGMTDVSTGHDAHLAEAFRM